MRYQVKSRQVRKLGKMMVVAAIGVFYLASWNVATAANQGQGPCTEDFAKFCKDIPQGSGRIGQCIKENENDFSAACKKHIAQMKQRSRDTQEACKDDSQRLCKDVQPEGGRLMKCLKAHESELSQACREKLPTGRRGN